MSDNDRYYHCSGHKRRGWPLLNLSLAHVSSSPLAYFYFIIIIIIIIQTIRSACVSVGRSVTPFSCIDSPP